MKKKGFMLIACLSAFVSIAIAQNDFGGNWEWKGKPDTNKIHFYFAIELKPKNGKVVGTMFFGELENGETTSDGAITPFIGTIKGDTIMLEFDSEVYEPSYTKNLRYRKPESKLSATATLRLKNGRLEWTLTRGSLTNEMPKQFILTR